MSLSGLSDDVGGLCTSSLVEGHYLRCHRMQFVALKLCELVDADTVVHKQLVQWKMCTHCKVSFIIEQYSSCSVGF
jgi:hypothetical protein